MQPPLPNKFGSYRCGAEGCTICEWITEGSRVVSMESGQIFDVRAPINCKSRHAVYVVSCSLCGMQGVGETFAIRERVEAYIRGVALEPGFGGTAIHQHFAKPGHTPEHFDLQLVDKLPDQMLTHDA